MNPRGRDELSFLWTRSPSLVGRAQPQIEILI
jgi:hypothetical protein